MNATKATDEWGDVAAITAEIEQLETALRQVGEDVARARAAIAEADASQRQLDAVGTKRAQIRALAFVAREPANTSELDREEIALEKTARRAIEDATAAELALDMLNERGTSLRQRIAELRADRNTLTIKRLIELREHLMDRYQQALENLGGTVAEAVACDCAIRKLDPNYLQTYGQWLYEAVTKEGALPIPLNRCTVRQFERPYIPGGLGGAVQHVTSPLTWLRYDPQFGDAEFAKLWAALAAVGAVAAAPLANMPASPKHAVSDNAQPTEQCEDEAPASAT